MKNLTCLLISLILLGCGSAAWAAEANYSDTTSGASGSPKADEPKPATSTVVTGTITAIDTKTGAITIDSQIVNIKPADLRMLRLRTGDQVKVTLFSGTSNISRVAILGHQNIKPAAKQPKAKTPATCAAPAVEQPQ